MKPAGSEPAGVTTVDNETDAGLLAVMSGLAGVGVSVVVVVTVAAGCGSNTHVEPVTKMSAES